MDLIDQITRHRGDTRALHERHLNGQMVRVLRTIGYDVQYTRAEGPYLYDAEDRRYLDLLSGWGVFAIGRNHPAVAHALGQVLQAGLPDMVQMDLGTLAGLLARRLAQKMPAGLDKLFFCNSGTEAVEAAIKFARQATGRSRIVSVHHGFHGLSLGSLSINGMDEFREGFGPLLADCTRVPFNDLAALEAALATRDVAAFIVEPIVGHGLLLPDDGYLPGVQALCRKYGTLLVADEIQTGLGRTGAFLAVEHWGVEPDMVCLAKALSGGFVPIGAVACRPRVFDAVFSRMDRAVIHGSTFSKNNLAMAAGLATLDVIDNEHLVERSARMGTALLADLRPMVEEYEFLHDVRGMGLMIGLEFGKPRSLRLRAAWHLLEAANEGLFCQMVTIPLFRDHRILAQVAGRNLPVVKFLPALTIGEDDRIWIRDAVREVLDGAHQIGGAIWDLGKQLAGAARRKPAEA